jgi:hypothetical protein
VKRLPDARKAIEKVHSVLNNIFILAGCTPRTVGETEVWTSVVRRSEADRLILCRMLEGKSLFGALYRVCSLTLLELKALLQLQHAAAKKATSATPTAPDKGEFRQQRRRKRMNSSEAGRPGSAKKKKKKKKRGSLTMSGKAIAAHPTRIPTRNFFAPLRAMEVDTNTVAGDGAESELPTKQQQNPVPKGTERPPPIILITSVNLLKFRAEIKAIMKGSFEFRTSRNVISVVTREMTDYSAIMRHSDAQNLPYYTFHPKSTKPMKAVIRHLPGNTPAEDISNEWVALADDCYQTPASRR